VEEIDPAAEYLLLVLDLDAESLARVDVTETLFELLLDFIRHVALPSAHCRPNQVYASGVHSPRLDPAAGH
jgi:hypothetical protein